MLLRELAPDFRLALEAARKSPKTILTYMGAVERLARFLPDTDVRSVRSGDINRFIVSLSEAGLSDSSCSVYYRGLQQFWNWAVREGEVATHPMAATEPPRIVVSPPDVLDLTAIGHILDECGGNDFRDRRDQAIIRLFLDTGLRRAEMAGLRVEDVDVSHRSLAVRAETAKGGRARTVAFGTNTALALSRYLRTRRDYPSGRLPELWVGPRGRLTDNGIYQVIRDRAEAAGHRGTRPHQLRHTWAHRNMVKGIAETDLMTLGGWTERSMLSRYGASAASERAVAAAHRVAVGDDY